MPRPEITTVWVMFDPNGPFPQPAIWTGGKIDRFGTHFPPPGLASFSVPVEDVDPRANKRDYYLVNGSAANPRLQVDNQKLAASELSEEKNRKLTEIERRANESEELLNEQGVLDDVSGFRIKKLTREELELLRESQREGEPLELVVYEEATGEPKLVPLTPARLTKVRQLIASASKERRQPFIAAKHAVLTARTIDEVRAVPVPPVDP